MHQYRMASPRLEAPSSADFGRNLGLLSISLAIDSVGQQLPADKWHSKARRIRLSIASHVPLCLGLSALIATLFLFEIAFVNADRVLVLIMDFLLETAACGINSMPILLLDAAS